MSNREEVCSTPNQATRAKHELTASDSIESGLHPGTPLTLKEQVSPNKRQHTTDLSVLDLKEGSRFIPNSGMQNLSSQG